MVREVVEEDFQVQERAAVEGEVSLQLEREALEICLDVDTEVDLAWEAAHRHHHHLRQAGQPQQQRMEIRRARPPQGWIPF